MADRVQCGACGAQWPEGARWCGACGEVLDDDPPRPAGGPSGTVVPERRWWHGAWRWALGVGVVAAVVAAVVVAGPVGGGGAPPVDDEGVALPDEADLADPGGGDGNGGDTGSNMACAPPGCEVWRFDDPVGPGVVASDELVVHSVGDRVSGEEMVARDAADGRELWRRPAPGRVSQNPQVTALSGHGLALVTGARSEPGNETAPEDAPPRVRLSVHDPLDGSHRFDVQLDAEIVVGVDWIGQHLVVQTATPERQEGNVAAFSPGGELLWEHEAAGHLELLPDGQTLLERGEQRVRRIGVEDGEVAWEVAGSVAGRPDPEDGLLVFDGRAGHVRVVDVVDGTTRTTVVSEGADTAADLGPWVLVLHEGELRVHDRSSGQVLFTQERGAGGLDAGPMRMASATRVGDRVVVAWEGYGTRDDGLELEVRGRDGDLERTLVVPEPDGAGEVPARGPVGLHHLTPDRAVVLVSAPGSTDTVVAVDIPSGEVLRRWSGMPVVHRGDLLALRREDGLSLLGPRGEVRVEHVGQVASTDPLVVYGVGGLMRLDRSLVADEDAPS